MFHVILSVAKNLRHRRANRWGTEILRYAQNDMARHMPVDNDYRFWSVNFIIGDGRDEPAPTGGFAARGGYPSSFLKVH